MKKILFFLVAALILTGCDLIWPKEDFDPVLVFLVPDKGTVDYQGDVYLLIEGENIKTFKFEGKKYTSNDLPMVIKKTLTETSTFSVEAFGFDGTSKTATATVVVNLPPAPVITITAPTEAIPFYGVAKVEWKIEGIFNKITLDGTEITSEPTGSRSFEKLIATASHTITAEGPGGTTTQTIQLLVGDWTTSVFGLLTQGDVGRFQLKKYDEMTLDRVVYNSEEIIEGIDPNWTIEISKDMFFRVKKDGKQVGSYKWTLSDDEKSIDAGDQKREIFSLTKDSLVLIEPLIHISDSGVTNELIKKYYKRL